MSLAAVILNYNDAQTTIDAASRVGGFSCVDHVVIVNNASTDESAVRIAETFDLELSGLEQTSPADDISGLWKSANEAGIAVTLIRTVRNGGYGYGNNLGVRYAYEQIHASEVLIANPDASISEETVREMQEVLKDDQDVAIVGAVMKDDGSSEISYAEFTAAGWCRRTLLKEVLHSGPLSKRIFRKQLEYSDNYYRDKDRIPVYAVHGSLLMVSAERFLSVGGYDTDMFLYMEEYVLGCRMGNSGWKTVLLPLHYQHSGSHSITGAGLDAVRRQQLRQQSERIYYRKYLGTGPGSMALIRLFQWIVLAETWAAAGLHRL